MVGNGDTEGGYLKRIDWENKTAKEIKNLVRGLNYYTDTVFEIKTKLCGKENNVGYKRRVRVTKRDYNNLTKGKTTILDLMPKNADSPNDYQVAREVDYLISHFDLKPKILVFYTRESYQGEGGLRITFDENLKYRTKNVNFTKQKSDQNYFNDEKNIIMEMKNIYDQHYLNFYFREIIFIKK